MDLKKFIQARREEIVKGSPVEVHPFIKSGFDLMELSILNSYSELSPDVSRKITMLESLMQCYLEHCFSLEKLDELEDYIKGVFH